MSLPATIVPSTPAASAPSAATRSPGPPQCAEVKPIRLPRLSLPIAVSVHKVLPSTTMPEPPPSGTGASARAEGSNTSHARSRLDIAAKATSTGGIVGQRTLVLKYLSPIEVPPDHPTGPVYRRPGSFRWTPHGNMNRDYHRMRGGIVPWVITGMADR